MTYKNYQIKKHITAKKEKSDIEKRLDKLEADIKKKVDK